MRLPESLVDSGADSDRGFIDSIGKWLCDVIENLMKRAVLVPLDYRLAPALRNSSQECCGCHLVCVNSADIFANSLCLASDGRILVVTRNGGEDIYGRNARIVHR